MARFQTHSPPPIGTRIPRPWQVPPVAPDDVAPPVLFDEQTDHDRAWLAVATLPAMADDTLVTTTAGPRRAGDIRVGDVLATCTTGDRPVRWVGHIRIRMLANAAPITLDPGVFGTSAALVLSPHQPLLFQGWRSELACGDTRTLIRAADLVNGTSIRRQPDGATLTYVALIFDRPELIYAANVPLACPGLDEVAGINDLDPGLPDPDPNADRLGPAPQYPMATPEQACAITGFYPVIW